MTAEASPAHVAGTVGARVARELTNRIVSGGFAPGEKLRQEQLAIEYAVSQATVREAFRRLEKQGLLVSEPRRGVRVAPLDAAAVEELTVMRAALEVVALKQAGPKIRDADLDAARTALKDGEKATDVLLLEDANRRFHMALLSPCGMPRLLATLEDLQHAASRYLFVTWEAQDWQARSDREHRQVVAALEAKDVEKATRLLHAHVLAAGEALVSKLTARGKVSAKN